MDVRTRVLIAVGAAVAADCHPRLENITVKARGAGLSDQDILTAAEVGNADKAGAAKSMDQLIAKLTGQVASGQSSCGEGCNC
nr:carboxymuconolactone decarboxylase family protein [Sporomusa silvacetica]